MKKPRAGLMLALVCLTGISARPGIAAEQSEKARGGYFRKPGIDLYLTDNGYFLLRAVFGMAGRGVSNDEHCRWHYDQETGLCVEVARGPKVVLLARRIPGMSDGERYITAQSDLQESGSMQLMVGNAYSAGAMSEWQPAYAPHMPVSSDTEAMGDDAPVGFVLPRKYNEFMVWPETGAKGSILEYDFPADGSSKASKQQARAKDGAVCNSPCWRTSSRNADSALKSKR